MFRDIFSGWGFILKRPEIGRIVCAKGSWAIGGGAQIFLLIIIGMEADFGDISTGAAGIGVLYMARGFGSGFGPIVTRPLMTVTRYMPYIIGLSLGGAGLLYVGVSQAEWGIWTLVLVFLSHGCSGISWVFSTTLLQRRTDNDWMGRVAGTDNLIIVLTMGVSTIAAGYILEEELVTLREILLVTGLVQLSVGALWLLLASPRERRFIESQNLGQAE